MDFRTGDIITDSSGNKFLVRGMYRDRTNEVPILLPMDYNPKDYLLIASTFREGVAEPRTRKEEPVVIDMDLVEEFYDMTPQDILEHVVNESVKKDGGHI